MELVQGFRRVTIAAVGPVVAAELETLGVQVDIMPRENAFFMKPLVRELAAALMKVTNLALRHRMSKTLKVQVIEKARALIEDERHWCRGELARDVNALSICPTDSGAERRCALGALIAAAYQITNNRSRAHALAISAVRPLYGSATLVNVNDVRGHTAVLALLDEVLTAV